MRIHFVGQNQLGVNPFICKEEHVFSNLHRRPACGGQRDGEH